MVLSSAPVKVPPANSGRFKDEPWDGVSTKSCWHFIPRHRRQNDTRSRVTDEYQLPPMSSNLFAVSPSLRTLRDLQFQREVEF